MLGSHGPAALSALRAKADIDMGASLPGIGQEKQPKRSAHDSPPRNNIQKDEKMSLLGRIEGARILI